MNGRITLIEVEIVIRRTEKCYKTVESGMKNLNV